MDEALEFWSRLPHLTVEQYEGGGDAFVRHLGAEVIHLDHRPEMAPSANMAGCYSHVTDGPGGTALTTVKGLPHPIVGRSATGLIGGQVDSAGHAEVESSGSSGFYVAAVDADGRRTKEALCDGLLLVADLALDELVGRLCDQLAQVGQVALGVGTTVEVQQLDLHAPSIRVSADARTRVVSCVLLSAAGMRAWLRGPPGRREEARPSTRRTCRQTG